MAFFAGAFGIAASSSGAHEVGALALFGTIACTFVAQFRVERHK
jgi:hypothetical protein